MGEISPLRPQQICYLCSSIWQHECIALLGVVLSTNIVMYLVYRPIFQVEYEFPIPNSLSSALRFPRGTESALLYQIQISRRLIANHYSGENYIYEDPSRPPPNGSKIYILLKVTAHLIYRSFIWNSAPQEGWNTLSDLQTTLCLKTVFLFRYQVSQVLFCF